MVNVVLIILALFFMALTVLIFGVWCLFCGEIDQLGLEEVKALRREMEDSLVSGPWFEGEDG